MEDAECVVVGRAVLVTRSMEVAAGNTPNEADEVNENLDFTNPTRS